MNRAKRRQIERKLRNVTNVGVGLRLLIYVPQSKRDCTNRRPLPGTN